MRKLLALALTLLLASCAGGGGREAAGGGAAPARPGSGPAPPLRDDGVLDRLFQKYFPEQVNIPQLG